MFTRNSTGIRGGFTLLEIMLTTAILLAGLTIVFQTTRSAMRHLTAIRELTAAQHACQSLLQELLAQSDPIQPHPGKTIEHLSHWKIRIDLYPAPLAGLYVLHLSAQQFSPQDGSLIGVKYQLLRWIPYERVGFSANVRYGLHSLKQNLNFPKTVSLHVHREAHRAERENLR